ncbi:MAG: helix-turn-helix transcriptional regulator, partial [bacterium]|nr:helix-turn-helix transcriptional regulator [bacterium]
DGVWNEEGVSIPIRITPPFWLTLWFRLLCLFIAVGLFYLWHKARMENLNLKLKGEAEMERIYEKYEISEREREIVALILKGKTNKDIEDVLFISLKTVKNHVYNIYRKFGVKTRLELINSIQMAKERKR